MLERQSYGRAGAASRTAAYRVYDHQYRTVSGLKKAVDVGRGPGFLDAILSQIRPHGGDKFLRVCHGLILTGRHKVRTQIESVG